MSKTKRVLIVMSSHEKLGISGKITGTWFEEVATPYYLLKESGFEVVLSTPKGGKAPLDLLSLEKPFTTKNTDKFLSDPIAMDYLSRTNIFNEINHDDFDSLFFPGGYGLLYDLASDPNVINVIENFVKSGKNITMICYAPAILRDVKKANGEPFAKNVTLTGFTDSEDKEIGLDKYLLFSLEQMLKNHGANYIGAEKNWDAHIEYDKDHNILTGQNPASANIITKKLIEILQD